MNGRDLVALVLAGGAALVVAVAIGAGVSGHGVTATEGALLGSIIGAAVGAVAVYLGGYRPPGGPPPADPPAGAETYRPR